MKQKIVTMDDVAKIVRTLKKHAAPPAYIAPDGKQGRFLRPGEKAPLGWRKVYVSIPAYVREQLRGKNLVCWCALDQPCHADVLLKIANGGKEKRT